MASVGKPSLGPINTAIHPISGGTILTISERVSFETAERTQTREFVPENTAEKRQDNRAIHQERRFTVRRYLR